MYKTLVACGLLTVVFACRSSKTILKTTDIKADFTLAFGSCNKTTLENILWDDVLEAKPDLWIWGGDIIYADTDNISDMRKMYADQDAIEGYRLLKKSVPVIGTWDDHDYGINDGGEEFLAKKESQQAFLDFMDVPASDSRRRREGVYVSHDYILPQGSIKVLVLDTRYFRTALTPDTLTAKRNIPNVYGQGSILGEAQWKWLGTELRESKADYNVLVSSIQVLSNEHGFETWGNFPHETDRLKELISASKAKGVLVLSGDRHISEFSRVDLPGVDYPLVDFTSSGLTHV